MQAKNMSMQALQPMLLSLKEEGRIMKKVLLMTLVLSLLISTVAFAAPSVGYVFSVYENGNVFYYMFGSTEKDIDEVGVTIQGKDYNLDENALTKAQESGKFGIGIADPKNVLKDSFEATPYNVIGESRNDGIVKTVVKNEVPDEDVIALNSLTVNGKAVSGFYTGTTETDFYYGLEEITSIESIPEVSYTLSMGNATTDLTEEKGGYVYTISVSATGRDGIDKNAEFKVHFREFAEKTVSVRPNIIYRQHYSYMDTMSAFEGLDTYTGEGLTISTNTVEDKTSNNNTYLYFAYEVEPVSGYAPVSFDLVGLRARYNPLDIYVYDGDLSDINLPKTVAETEANSDLFAGNKGLNDSDSFHLVKFQVPAGEILLNQGIVASSTAVTDGNNILILKSDYPQTGNYPAYILYGDWAKCFMTMNVKYVEKNPKDETDIDTTVSSLKINGEDATAVKDNTYYVAVSDLATNDGIEAEDIIATPTVEGATYEVSEIVNNQATVTVTAKDGETTEEYTVKFKDIEEKVLTAESSYPFIRWNYSTKKYGYANANYWYANDLSTGLESETKNIDVVYAQFPTGFSSDVDIKLVSNATIKGQATRNQIYKFYNTTYDEIKSGLGLTFAEFTGDEQAKYLGEFIRTNATGSDLSVSFEASLLDIKPDGKIKIALIDGLNDGSNAIFDSASAITLTVNYITLD